MKIKISPSPYYRNRVVYTLRGVKKCSGFYHFWKCNIRADCPSGKGYFVQAEFIYADKKGKSYYSDKPLGIEIKKHCKNGWEARKVMRFLYELPIDYVRNL